MSLDNGDTGRGQGSFCYLHTKRHEPSQYLQNSTPHRVGDAGGDNLKYNNGKGRDWYHLATNINA